MKKLLVILLVGLFFPFYSYAAEVKLEKNTESEKVGLPTKVLLYFKSPEGPLNALSGSLFLKAGFFERVKIIEENSVVGLWVKKPTLKDDRISFSAVMPGGVGEGSLFTLELTPRVLGSAEIYSDSITGFLNDGEGTQLNMAGSRVLLSVTEVNPEVLKLEAENFEKNPPQPFQIRQARDPKIFNNQWFAVFSTTDLDSGIAYYEVAEVMERAVQKEDWFRQESPYIFKDQNRKSFLFVRAYDNRGNFAESVLEPEKGRKNFSVLYFCVIILTIIAAVVFWFSRKQNVKKK
ncbi:MAG: hypothetical protein JNN11_03055 [Candidatus Doudnabacteria bacterium]|nr:hypothetical protein [Candidatus Doudnabacteria bacterium]